MKHAFDFTECEANKARIDAYRPLPPETLKSLRDYYRIGLTYSSNALEGNSLTEAETKIVIEDGLTVDGKPLHDVYEAVGHAKAYDHIYNLVKSAHIAEADILKLHEMFYQQIDRENAGRYRTVRVFISGSHHRLPSPEQIPRLMADFVAWFNDNENKRPLVEFAARVHQKFVFIHPFVDGNGRVSRLLMNLALLRAGYTISIIPPILRGEYIAALEKAHTDVVPFIEFIKGRVAETQRELLHLFGESGGVNAAIGGVNGGVKSAQKQIVAAIRQLPGINGKGIARQLDIPLRTLQRHLGSLSAAGKIEFRGAPKNGGYFIRPV
mgnify:CR=1 FL=1